MPGLFNFGEETEERLEEDPAPEAVSMESLAVVAEEVAAVAGVAGVAVVAVAVMVDVDGWEDDAVPDSAPDPDPVPDPDVEVPVVFDIENSCLERDKSMLGNRASADLKTWEGMGSDSKDWDLITSLLSSGDFEDSLSAAALPKDVGLAAVVVVVVGAPAEVASVLVDRRLFLLEAVVELEGDREDVNKEEGN